MCDKLMFSGRSVYWYCVLSFLKMMTDDICDIVACTATAAHPTSGHIQK